MTGSVFGGQAKGTWDIARHYPLHQREVRYVKIAIHVVRYSDGTGGIFPETRIQEEIDNLNNHVISTGLFFFQYGDIIYLDSDEYASCSSGESYALREIDAVPRSVNIWFVPDFEPGCGRASFPDSSTQGIIVQNSCAGTDWNDSTFTHEVGHYFHLYHTHETYFGNECVSGDNCTVAGDLICDTPADPNISGLVNSSTCLYEGDELDICGSGDPYSPLPDNLMSYSSKLCRDYFTEEQLSVFLWSAEHERASHFYCFGDVTGNGLINISDLLLVINYWGTSEFSADVNFDDIVDIADLLIVIGNWGPCE